jgi:DNA-binding transcriptional MerR regulator
MRIGELSTRSGVPVSTIKYYLRVGLLPAGELTSPNQARYGAEHLRGLGLVRVLVEVGGLPIAAVREVLAALGTSGEPRHRILSDAQRGITVVPAVEPDGAAEVRTREFLSGQGFDYDAGHPAVRSIVAVLTIARLLGYHRFVDRMEAYADACRDVAEADVEYAMRHAAVDEVVESLVIRTVLGDALLTTLCGTARTRVAAGRSR